MNQQPAKPANNKNPNLVSDRWNEVVVNENEEFDSWMTRQLNCLVGRHLNFATPNTSSARNSAAATSRA